MNDVAHVHFVIGDRQQRLVLFNRDQRDVAVFGGQRGNPTQAARRHNNRAHAVECHEMRSDVIESLDRHQAGSLRETLQDA